MKKTINIIGYFILISTVGFHLWLNFPETQILADPNDNIFQYELVARSDWVWENYGCPFSFSCLGNLVDHNVTAWAEGYPLPFYYSHLPQLTIVSSYHMIVKPFVSIINPQFSVYQYYNWVKYLLLGFFPLPVFLALRLLGFSPFISAVSAFFASNFSTDGLYGIDPPSFLWRGYGLSAQLYAQFFLPLAIVFTYRALCNGLTNSQPHTGKNHSNWNIVTRDSVFASLFLTLTTAGHLGVGIIGLLSTVPFFFMDLKKSAMILRGKKLFLIYCGVFFALSYWLIPILSANQYHIVSFWDPIWKFDSYGWYEAFRQLFMGELFDWKRPAVVTILVFAGSFISLVSEQKMIFSFLFAFWVLMYFGRTTWGGLIDLLPGMKDFHLHRFLVGIQLAGIFLIPAALEWMENTLRRILEGGVKFILVLKSATLILARGSTNKINSEILRREGNSFLNEADEIFEDSRRDIVGGKKILSASDKSLQSKIPKLELSGKSGIKAALQTSITITVYIILISFLSILAYFTLKQTLDYAYYNNKWIKEANTAYKYDEKNFEDLLSYLRTKPNARIYAGRPGNWGRDFKLGSTELYMLLSVNGFDISQFLPETWSMLSENDQNFDERVAADYDLLNIRYVVAPKNQGFSDKAQSIKKFGPFELFEAPTTGWFDIVTSQMFVKTEKTNFVNLVHYWHRSYPRLWKMHPLISVEKNPDIPAGMQRVITMADEVSYTEGGQNSPTKNIFSDYPLVFPASTASGQIKSETVETQTYSAVVEVGQNCTMCFAMFKMSYHPDWEARVDGVAVPKYAVFPFYLAAPVTSGTHTVEFTYKPNTLKVILLWGEIIAVVAFIGWRVRNRVKKGNR